MGDKSTHMKTPQKISGYLQFTRKDRIALLVIALILLTAYLLPTIVENRVSPTPPPADTAWMTAIHELEKPIPSAKRNGYKRQEEYKTGENEARDRTADGYNNEREAQLFSFDPNTLNKTGWEQLGLREKTIGTIQKYLAKGGRFHKPEDLKKIYGLSPADYDRLAPYIMLAKKEATSMPGEQASVAGQIPFRSRVITPVEINTADSAAWESLPGIGPALAMRILRFREKLGGFHSTAQIKEIYGLADSTFERIKPYLLHTTGSLVKKININTATYDLLKSHPYIGHVIARVIVSYRNEHGNYAAIDDLKKINIIDAAVYTKLAPYVRTE